MPTTPPTMRSALASSIETGRGGAGPRGSEAAEDALCVVALLVRADLRCLVLGFAEAATEHRADLRERLRTAPDDGEHEDDDENEEQVAHGRDGTRPVLARVGGLTGRRYRGRVT